MTAMTVEPDDLSASCNMQPLPDLDWLRARTQQIVGQITEQLQALRTYFGDVIGVPLDSSLGEFVLTQQQLLDVAYSQRITISNQGLREARVREELDQEQADHSALRESLRARLDREAEQVLQAAREHQREVEAWRTELKSVTSPVGYRACSRRVQKALAEQ